MKPLVDVLVRALREVIVELAAQRAHPKRWLYTLAEVAELTGFSERSLLDDCRAGRIAHVHRGRAYGLTPEQLESLIATHIVTPSPTVDPQESHRQRVAAMLARARGSGK